jgi:hypothetical protein
MGSKGTGLKMKDKGLRPVLVQGGDRIKECIAQSAWRIANRQAEGPRIMDNGKQQ